MRGCILILILTFALPGYAQEKPPKPEMRQYFFVMLKRGPNRSQDSVTTSKLQEGHMANINRMATEDKLAIAGPFGDDGDWRGIFIMTVATIEDARKEIEQDPAVKAGRLVYEIHPWWSQRGAKLP